RAVGRTRSEVGRQCVLQDRRDQWERDRRHHGGAECEEGARDCTSGLRPRDRSQSIRRNGAGAPAQYGRSEVVPRWLTLTGGKRKKRKGSGPSRQREGPNLHQERIRYVRCGAAEGSSRDRLNE